MLVMAAGIGSRYGGLKQIDPVGVSGEKIVDYSIYDAQRAGFDRVVFIIRKEIEKEFRNQIGRRIEDRIDTHYAYQELDHLPAGYTVPPDRSKPWGTAHAVSVCQGLVDIPFGVINADDFYGAASFRVLHEHLRQSRERDGVYDACLVGYILENTLSEHGHVARGVCSSTEEGLLQQIDERSQIQRLDGKIQYSDDGVTWTELAPDTLVSMNMWGLTPGFLDELVGRFPAFLDERIHDPKAEYFLPHVIGELISEGRMRVKVLPSRERWFGVTYSEDRAAVQKAIRDLVEQGAYPKALWE